VGFENSHFVLSGISFMEFIPTCYQDHYQGTQLNMCAYNVQHVLINIYLKILNMFVLTNI